MKKLIVAIILLSLLALNPDQGSAMQSPSVHHLPPAALQAEDLADFSDAFFAEKLDSLRVPGAGLVVVQGGETLLAEGYGRAVVDPEIEADANTVFRAGSVSKILTVTAVMQLVEQGRLDLHADVNDYLTRFKLQTAYPQPVTVADLLLHTGGFDEDFLGSHARSAAERLPLGDYLAAHMPPQTAPPGQFISYNDHTMSLAGFLVEEVSGKPFADYVSENILEPLGMENSTFAQPAPTWILDRLATGYALKGDGYRPFQYDYINVGPAAALLTTAADMGAFISAHLSGGGPLMDVETLEQMHTTHFRHHELLRGRAYGFSELFINGRRVLFHDGGNPGFGSRLMLVPEEGVGFFITFNIDQFDRGGRLHREFTQAFFDRYFPAAGEYSAPEPGELLVDTSRYTGYYREMQAYSHFTIQKLVSLMNQFPVREVGEGALFTAGSNLVPVADNVFAWDDVDGYVTFRENDAGEISHMFFGTGAFVRLKWTESQPFHIGLAGLFVLVFLSAGVAAFFPGVARAGAYARPLLGLTGILNLTFLVGIGLLLMQTSQWEFTYGIPTMVKALLVLPIISIFTMAGLLYLTGSAWWSGDVQGVLLGYLVFVVLVSAGYLVFLKYWNLLGW